MPNSFVLRPYRQTKALSMKQLFVFAFLSLVTLSMQAQEVTMIIGPDKVSCTGVAPMQCLQYKYADNESWKTLYGGIEGFEHQAGYRYVLLVREERIIHPPADGSSIKHTLIKVLDQQKVSANPTQMLQGPWILDAIRTGDSLETIGQLHYTVEMKDGQMFAHLCNRLRGPVMFGKEGQFKAGPVVSTKMICPQIAYENAFSNAWQNADGYKVTETGWMLMKGDTILAVLKKAADSTQLLDKKTFAVIALHDSTGTTDMRATKAFMRFDVGEYRVTGKGGCNNYFGSISLQFEEARSGSMQFSKIGSTMMACPQYMDLEQKFYQLLAQVDKFEIKGNQLRLMKAGTLLIELENQ
jgi:heat shock protein HslJ